MTEISPDLIRRVLVATEFDNTSDLWWRLSEDKETLLFFANCSDFFALATADLEPIQTEEDVVLLESCLRDLREATGDTYPADLAGLYAARRRNVQPHRGFLAPGGRYYLGDKVAALFLELRPQTDKTRPLT